MALTRAQMDEFSDANKIPVGKALCILRASYDAYRCFIAAPDDKTKCECAFKFFAEVEKCLSA